MTYIILVVCLLTFISTRTAVNSYYEKNKTLVHNNCMIWICILAGVMVYIIIQGIFKSCYELTVLRFILYWLTSPRKPRSDFHSDKCMQQGGCDWWHRLHVAVDFLCQLKSQQNWTAFHHPCAFHHLLHFIIPYSNATTYTYVMMQVTYASLFSIKFRVPCTM